MEEEQEQNDDEGQVAGERRVEAGGSEEGRMTEQRK